MELLAFLYCQQCKNPRLGFRVKIFTQGTKDTQGFIIHHTVYSFTSLTHTIHDKIIQFIIPTQCLILWWTLNGNVGTVRRDSIPEAGATLTNVESINDLSLVTTKASSKPQFSVPRHPMISIVPVERYSLIVSLCNDISKLALTISWLAELELRIWIYMKTKVR